ncbi:probable glycosyl transferase, family 2 [Crocosphaera subtropica ATCC 51142]|uniref:Probable glycosyl transferase, family 2 n=1 Tax=Crocosphaera subtropica (strain ATCC 51142 / BH68) TaxID=43989 RepID=B1WQK2_CROS5|nr:glycosyltransferase family 2 protein [Crocosphaera subtropica]ACB51713.1 probable glycosyl transferase, family 2 [Crocosphaera subtropica ATCC 51142]
MPKVTIIIPSYNHAKFLEQRLDSILNQTYQDFEIIFLDDASSDNTKEVFSKYANHPKIKKAIFNSQNSGSPFKQWNRGVKEAKGEYIWIAESDDCADEKFLETLVPLLEDAPKIGIAYCQSLQINEEGKITANYSDYTQKIANNRWNNDFTNSGINEVANYLIIQNTIPNASAVLMRKKAYIEAGMAPENMRLSGDWYCYLKILKNYDIAFCHQSLNYYRYHSQMSRAYSEKDKRKRLIQYIENYIILNFVSTNFKVLPEKQASVYLNLIRNWSSIVSLLDCLNWNFWKLMYYYLRDEPSQLKYGKLVLRNLIKNTQLDLKVMFKIDKKNIKSTQQKVNQF